jgi:ribA/ribD-fused uncharacterized protein
MNSAGMNSALPADVEALRTRAAAGERFAYLHFWGHRQGAGGAVSKSCFSQWYASPFVVDGVRYATAEHWMMAEKARLFRDEDALSKIVANDDPSAAKAFGRKVRDYDDAVWCRHRFEIVVAGNLAKFSQHPRLAGYLLSTGEQVLVEASPFDAIWGVGLAAGDPRAHDPAQWPGLNLLGFALMNVRTKLGEMR